jgi:hypothetical protein
MPLERLSWPRGRKTVVGVGETGLGAVEGRWRPPLVAGWRGGMGMPRGHILRARHGRSGRDSWNGGAPDDEEAVVVSKLPKLRVRAIRGLRR